MSTTNTMIENDVIAQAMNLLTVKNRFSFSLRERYDTVKKAFTKDGNKWGGTLALKGQITNAVGERDEKGLMKAHLNSSEYIGQFDNLKDLLENGVLSYDSPIHVKKGEKLPFAKKDKPAEISEATFWWLPNCTISRRS